MVHKIEDYRAWLEMLDLPSIEIELLVMRLIRVLIEVDCR